MVTINELGLSELIDSVEYQKTWDEQPYNVFFQLQVARAKWQQCRLSQLAWA